ncbi:site-specific integrase [Patescibacteria group bacterium]|nr:site-specific integrase [Patescibacteria group bacterium]
MNLPNQIKTAFSFYLTKVRKSSPVTVKNYLSDLGQFFQWADDRLKAQNSTFEIGKIDSLLLDQYRSQLLTEEIAKSTVRRRLATIKVFCQFCLNQRLLEKNPSLGLGSSSEKNPIEKQINDWASLFGSYLKEQGAGKSTIKNYAADVKNYLKWTLSNSLF